MRTYELIKNKDDPEADIKYNRRASRKDEAFPAQKQGQRVVSLDVFRGLTVAVRQPSIPPVPPRTVATVVDSITPAVGEPRKYEGKHSLMIFVDDAGALFPSINHSPWDGVALADFVMPFFLFIVGVTLAITHKLCAQGVTNKAVATRKSVLRALKLFVVGLLIQGMQLF
ncbi:hypothetical protein BHM03_00011534 [Ensete ventricosum]|uniref:Heparan-alpha-glucosaminide N-acetyltransferase catalytic domain-containing protein n=1 Tax=Ensete ventricosum TaxID=4639 RepID=A0A445MDC1_ENSVE|nr:hypothetical protein BHM03_00011534 [Ensete ventricosum]